MKRVIHTIGALSADMGGPSRTVPRLCLELQLEKRWQPSLVCAAPTDEPVAPLAPDAPHATYTGNGWPYWQHIGRLINQDRNAPHIVHDHGMWMGCNAVAALQAFRRRVPLVISPRGMLQSQALGFRSTKKRLALLTYQRWLLRRASAFHATSSDEADSIRRLGLRQPILVLANGVDVPEAPLARPTALPRRRALFLSRIHPHKGVLTLLQAWAQLQPAGWELRLVGPGEPGFRAEVQAFVRSMPGSASVQLCDAVADDSKWNEYAASELLILPSLSENFGVVVAESLAVGVPVITTTGTPWAALPQRNCGWCIRPELAPLIDALRAATAMSPDQLAAMGCEGRAWMQRQFSWHGVGHCLADFYDWLAAGSPAAAAPSGTVLA